MQDERGERELLSYDAANRMIASARPIGGGEVSRQTYHGIF